MFGLSTITTEAIAAAIVALLIFGGGMKLQYDLDASKYDKLVLEYRTAQEKAQQAAAAQQKEIDAQALAASTAEAQAQSDRAAALSKELQNVKNHVIVRSISSDCVPYGFLRVLYAGSHGVSADSLTLPAGQSDGSCAPIGWSDLASAILHDYGQANANAGQLTALQNLLRQEGVVLKGQK